MIYQSLSFWTLVAGLAAFVARFFFPEFPLDAEGILALVLFGLGLIGVVPTVNAMGTTFGDLVRSLAFWQAVAGLIWFVSHFFFPAFPLDAAGMLAFLLFILGLFQVNPELRARGLLGKAKK